MKFRHSLLFLGIFIFLISFPALAQSSIEVTDAASETTLLADKSNLIDEDSLTSDGNWLVSIPRGILGMGVLILIAYLFSSNRRMINWRLVGVGLSIQLVLAVSILKVSFIRVFFEFVGKIFVVILDFTRIGSEFLFGNLMDTGSVGYIFALQILPTIIFFSAITSVLFYLGIIQKIVYVLT